MANREQAAGPGGVGEVRAEYARRLEARRAMLTRQDRRERRIADARLTVFVVGLVVAGLAFVSGRISPGWLALPVALFVVLVSRHEPARRARRRAERAAEFYEKGLARLDNRWPGTGLTGLRFLDDNHPYAADLDLFGRGSVFERLCTARTRVGEETLAGWLLSSASSDEIRARQLAVTELRPRLDLREDLELLGVEIHDGITPDELTRWGEAARVFDHSTLRWAAVVLSAVTLTALAGWDALGTPSPFLAMLFVQWGFNRLTAKWIERALGGVEERTHDLALFAALLARLEREPFDAPRLGRLHEALLTRGVPASRQIARLTRLLHWLESDDNLLFAPLAWVLNWKLHFAYAIDAWRAASGPSIGGWLAAAGEFEALGALAGYAYECQADTFPEIADEGTGACFEAKGVGHPLIAEADCVRNDVDLGGALRVLVVSGSNMSGKSTLLRTVGVNAVLALTGAPVRAGSLRIAPMAIGATLRVQDSLQAGRSRFFAEITRIRQLVDLSKGERPLLFLLDEIFHGTNSHDRRIGAEGIVVGLIERGAIGLVTTHDLALAEIGDRLAPRAENIHFEDRFENGTMQFDYRIRPGIVRHSNALALMRAVGLEV